MSPGPLVGLRVLDLGQRIAGPYAGKLLADLGADVIKLERPEGDPLRAWGPFPDDRPDGDRAGLFRYLNANKRGVVLDLATEAGRDAARALVEEADCLIENFRPGVLESLGLGPEDLRDVNPRLALVRISSFGQTGPLRDWLATDLVVQAAGAWVASYGSPSPEPVRVGGRMAEWVAGAFAACSALTAVTHARAGDESVVVDLAQQAMVVGTLSYPMIMLDALRAQPQTRPVPPAKYAPFGIVRCKDGYVGINILTDAHWANACRVVGAPEFAESRGEVARQDVEHEAFQSKLVPWLEGHTAAEIVQLCQAARIPTAAVGNGQTLVDSPQLEARGFLRKAPGGDFLQPGFPCRLGASKLEISCDAPTLGRVGGKAKWLAREGGPLGLEAGEGASGLPFQGLRVLDLGTFWAGPYLAMYLASLGADVVKVESVQRPDGFRFVAPVDVTADDWYEAGALFQATNLGKRGVTLDLSRAEGRALLRRLIAGADVLIENFAPRVMERFGFDWEGVKRIKPALVMVRMPAFGLDGPARDHVGWAMAIAQAAGISWLTGNPDEAPRNPGAFLDPCAAMHAGVALQAALAHRRKTGEGQLIEIPQFETTLCLCAEPIITWTQNGRLEERRGNRSQRIAPQGVYGCRGGAHLALSVRSDAEWQSLCRVMGREDLAGDPALATAADRLPRQDALDGHLRAWAEEQQAAEAALRLQEVGVPAAEVLTTARMYGEPQLEARDTYQTLEHPVSGERRYPVWPMRFSFSAGPAYATPTPTLGQHNDEILGGELGLSREELAALREAGVIGERWLA